MHRVFSRGAHLGLIFGLGLLASGRPLPAQPFSAILTLNPPISPVQVVTFPGDPSKVWFADPFKVQVGSFTAAGAVTAFPMPQQGSDIRIPISITPGDG